MDPQVTLSAIREKLDLSISDLPDDDLPVVLSSLLVAAARDDDPRHPLELISQTVVSLGLVEEIDPFTAVPVLMPCPQAAADDLLLRIAEKCSAKEMIIVVAEAAEGLLRSIAHEDDESEDDDGEVATHVQKTLRIIKMYARAIPRLKPGNRLPSQILTTPYHHVGSLLGYIRHTAQADDTQLLLRALNKFISVAAVWSRQFSATFDRQLEERLTRLLRQNVELYANKVDQDVAQRAFEQQFPRFIVPGQETDDQNEDTRDVLFDIIITLGRMGTDVKELSRTSSIDSIVLLAHLAVSRRFSPDLSTLRTFSSHILAAIQANVALKSTIALVLYILGPFQTLGPPYEVDSEMLLPLAHILPRVAAVHPEPQMRHITFRLLSLVLSLLPSHLRFHLLCELLVREDTRSIDDEGFSVSIPQMRIAAIGLVKEAVTEALSTSQPGVSNTFASRKFMPTFTPLIFMPQMPEHTGGEPEEELEEFLQSPEPLRLVESLGLYYVVLHRDKENKTGIRDAGSLKDISTSFVDVLKTSLGRWNEVDLGESEDAKLQLGILDMWVEWVSAAISAIQASSEGADDQ